MPTLLLLMGYRLFSYIQFLQEMPVYIQVVSFQCCNYSCIRCYFSWFFFSPNVSDAYYMQKLYNWCFFFFSGHIPQHICDRMTESKSYLLSKQIGFIMLQRNIHSNLYLMWAYFRCKVCCTLYESVCVFALNKLCVLRQCKPYRFLFLVSTNWWKVKQMLNIG